MSRRRTAHEKRYRKGTFNEGEFVAACQSNNAVHQIRALSELLFQSSAEQFTATRYPNVLGVVLRLYKGLALPPDLVADLPVDRAEGTLARPVAHELGFDFPYDVGLAQSSLMGHTDSVLNTTTVEQVMYEERLWAVAMVVRNLSFDMRTHEAILNDAAVVVQVVAFLRSRQRFVALVSLHTLASLAHNMELHRYSGLDLITPLVAMLQLADPAFRYGAADALGRLCNVEDNWAFLLHMPDAFYDALCPMIERGQATDDHFHALELVEQFSGLGVTAAVQIARRPRLLAELVGSLQSKLQAAAAPAAAVAAQGGLAAQRKRPVRVVRILHNLATRKETHRYLRVFEVDLFVALSGKSTNKMLEETLLMLSQSAGDAVAGIY